MKEKKFKHLGKQMRERRDPHGNLIGYVLEDVQETPQDSLSNGSLDTEKQLFDFIERWSDKVLYTVEGDDKIIQAYKDNMEIKLIFKKT
jgi:hypothetical protein